MGKEKQEMNSIPTEIVTNILQLCEATEFRSISLVCTQWRAIISDQQVLVSWLKARIDSHVFAKYAPQIGVSIDLRRFVEDCYMNAIREQKFISLCNQFNLNGNEVVFYITEYLALPPLESGQIDDVFSLAEKVMASSTQFVLFIDLFIHLYLQNTEFNIRKLLSVLILMRFDGINFEMAKHFMKRHFKCFDLSQYMPNTFKSLEGGRFFLDNPEMICEYGISTFVIKTKFPEDILQQWLDAAREGHRTLFMQMLIYQTLSCDFVRHNIDAYKNDTEVTHAAARYQKYFGDSWRKT